MFVSRTLLESVPNTGRKTTPTGGSRLSVADRGEGRRTGPNVGNGPAERVGPAWRRKRKEGEGRERFWAGLERERRG